MGTQNQSLEIMPQGAPTLTRGGNLIDATAITQLFRMAKVWWESGLLPKHVDSPAKALTIAMMGDALGINYLTALQELYVVHGTVGCKAKLARAMVLRSGLVESYSLVTSATSATFRITRKGFPEHVETVTMEQAKRAGWTKNEKYQTEPETMLGERASMRGLRKVFPDVILGLYSYDELGLTTTTRGEVETIEIDSIPEPAPAQAEQAAAKPDPMAEARVGDIATDAQRARLKELAKTSYPDGSPVVLPSERRKITDAVVADSSATGFAMQIEFWEAEVARRLEAREAEQAAREVAGS